MRVLYITETLGKGGTENQLSLLADRLRTFGHKSSVIALSEGGWWASYLAERGIPVSTLKFKAGRGFWPKNLRQFYRLVLAIRQHKPDAVIGFLYPCSIWTSLAARLAGVPVVIASRRDCGFQRREDPLPAWLERLSHAGTTVFVVNSRAVAESLQMSEGVPTDKIKIIYNGIDLPEIDQQRRSVLRQRLGFSDSWPVVGMVANFWPHKNHLMLVYAAELTVTQLPNVGFILAGGYDRYQRQVETEITEMGLDKNFRLLGQIDGAHNLLPAVDVCVLCSQSEGFSNTILEYMAYGKPVIATRVGGNPEVVDDQETGFLVDLGDTEGLANSLLKLIRDPSKGVAMGQRGRDRVEAEFNWDIALKRWDEVLRS